MRLIHIQKGVFTCLLLFSLGSCSTKKESQSKSQENTTKEVSAELAPSAIPDTTYIIPSRLITPGKSIGLTALQEKAEIATARLCKPDRSDAAMGKALASWFSRPAAGALDTTSHQTTLYFKTNMGAPDEASRVNQIRVTSPYFLTADSIHVSSDWSTIQKYFPDAIKVAAYTLPRSTAKITIYDAVAAGITFEMNEQEQCVAITVHEANQGIKGTYLPLFPDMEIF